MIEKYKQSSLISHLNLELPPVSKWHKPACNRVIELFDTWASVEIWPSIIIKVDLIDLAFVMKHRWNLKRTRTQGILIVNGSEINGGRGQITLQKHLLGGSKKSFAYFINQSDRLDFRRLNLELRNSTLRAVKQKKRTTPTTSQYRGVSLISKSKKWAAQICVKQHSINLGSFDSEVEAALAYNKASRHHYGEDGYQNEIKSDTQQKSS